MSSDLKLNNLVDLLLVIGSDPSSGLELLKSSRAFQSRNKSRENEAKYDSSSHSCNGNMTSSNEEKANSVGLPDEDDDLMMKLTDPEANYDAKVLQMFSAKLASYPHRGDDEQLVGYPHQLLTSCVHSQYQGSDELDEEYDEFDSASPSLYLKNKLRRQSHQALRRRGGIQTLSEEITPHEKLYRSSSLSAAGLGAGGRRLSKVARRQSYQSRRPSAAVTMLKSKAPELPLAMDQISALCNLCYPAGFRCSESSHKPSVITYVLTDVDGNRFYAVSLTFYKKYMVTALESDPDVGTLPRYKLIDPDGAVSVNTNSDDMSKCADVFIPTCVVLVTSFPYYNTLHKCLSEFYTAIQPNFTSLDEQVKQLASAVTNIPVPPPGGDLSLTFKICIRSAVQRHGISMTVNPAPHSSRPITDLNMHILFSLLHPNAVCTIVAALLQEQRVVFVSSRLSLLTLVQEILMHMIFPFRWQSMYVPVLNDSMITFLEAPGYYVMGCHSDFLSTTQLIDGLVVVDLDKGRVTPSSNDHFSPLPLKAASPFCTKIVDTEMNFDLYMAGEVRQNLSKAREEFQARVNKEISTAALAMMVHLFGDVHDYVITEQKFFDKSAFLSSQTSEDQQFYSNVLDTTMFKVFLREVISECCSDIWISKATDRQRKESARPISRTNRSIQSREHKKSLISIQYENNCKELSLPYIRNLAEFQEDSVLNLAALLEVPSSNKLRKAACLYVIGCINLQREELVEALNNFGNVWIRDSSLFPETAIVKELSRHEFPQEIIDKVDPSHQKLYTDLLLASHSKQSKHKVFGTDVKVDLDSLPTSAVDETEFYKYSERLDFAVSRDAISRLYQALTLGKDIKVQPEWIKLFYECWKDNEAECRDMEVTLNFRCEEGELVDTTVLKVSSPLVRTDYGNGTVILTSRSLLLLKTGCQVESVVEIARLSSISKLVVENVTIVLKPVQCLRVYAGSSVKPINIFLEAESRTWDILLRELIGGKIISTNMRDLFLMEQASQNVLLLDALVQSSKSVDSVCFHSKDVSMAVDLLSHYAKEETKQKLLIACSATRETLLYRLNPNADELDTVTVECIIYVPGVSSTSSRTSTLSPRMSLTSSRFEAGVNVPPTVWCGMGNGKIRIFDASSWRLYPRYVQAVDRVVSLSYTCKRIWAGSFDNLIYVIENNPLALEFQTLDQHTDYVVDIQNDPSSSEHVFSGAINGSIIQWDANQLEVLREFHCTNSILTSFRVISHKEIWCCCKDSLVKIDINGTRHSLLYYVDERDSRRYIDTFCIVDDYIWAGCSDIGRVVVWSKTDEVRKAILPLDTRGVSQMVSIGSSLYLGCKSAYTKRRSITNAIINSPDTSSKSRLYVVDAKNFAVTEELSAHNDTIRCMFAVKDQYLLTGSSGTEGKIAIWKHHQNSEKVNE